VVKRSDIAALAESTRPAATTADPHPEPYVSSEDLWAVIVKHTDESTAGEGSRQIKPDANYDEIIRDIEAVFKIASTSQAYSKFQTAVFQTLLRPTKVGLPALLDLFVASQEKVEFQLGAR